MIALADWSREPRRTPWWYATAALVCVLASLIAVGVPLALAALAIVREPRQWHWNDWSAMLSSISTGIFFFILAWVLDRNGSRRAEAVANAELITSMGTLSTSSARSFAGHDTQALRIAADARAVLVTGLARPGLGD